MSMGISEYKQLAGDWILQFFGILSEEDEQALRGSIEIATLKKGRTIYKENSQVEHIMFLLEGKAKVYKRGIQERDQIVRIIKQREWFGFRAFFARENYTTTASALESTVVAKVPAALMSVLAKRNPKILSYFTMCLARELGKSDTRIIALTQKRIRARLAETLLLLRERYGLEQDGFTLSIYLSREDLAGISNMTTSNAIRTLSQFANEGMVIIDGRKIKLLNLEELMSISTKG